MVFNMGYTSPETAGKERSFYNKGEINLVRKIVKTLCHGFYELLLVL
jgi:hypothetical protein